MRTAPQRRQMPRRWWPTAAKRRSLQKRSRTRPATPDAGQRARPHCPAHVRRRAPTGVLDRRARAGSVAGRPVAPRRGVLSLGADRRGHDHRSVSPASATAPTSTTSAWSSPTSPSTSWPPRPDSRCSTVPSTAGAHEERDARSISTTRTEMSSSSGPTLRVVINSLDVRTAFGSSDSARWARTLPSGSSANAAWRALPVGSSTPGPCRPAVRDMLRARTLPGSEAGRGVGWRLSWAGWMGVWIPLCVSVVVSCAAGAATG